MASNVAGGSFDTSTATTVLLDLFSVADESDNPISSTTANDTHLKEFIYYVHNFTCHIQKALGETNKDIFVTIQEIVDNWVMIFKKKKSLEEIMICPQDTKYYKKVIYCIDFLLEFHQALQKNNAHKYIENTGKPSDLCNLQITGDQGIIVNKTSVMTKLIESLTDVERSKLDIINLQKQIDTLTVDNDRLKNENSLLNTHNETKVRELEKLQQTLSSKDSEIQSYKTELQTRIDTQEKENEELRISNSSLQKTTENLKLANEEIISKLQSDNLALQQQNDRLNQEILDSQSKLESSQSQLRNLTQENSELITSINGLNGDLKTKDTEIQQLNSNIEILEGGMEEQTKNHQVNMDEMIEKLEEKSKQTELLQNEVEELKSINIKLSDKINGLKENISDLGHINNELTTDNQKLKEKADTKDAEVRSLQKKLDTTSGENIGLLEKLTRCHSENEQLHKKEKELETEITRLNQDLKSNEISYNEQLTTEMRKNDEITGQLQTTIKEKDKHINILETIIAEKDGDLQNKKELEEKVIRFEALTEELENSKRDKEILIQEMSKLNNENSSLTKNMKELEVLLRQDLKLPTEDTEGKANSENLLELYKSYKKSVEGLKKERDNLDEQIKKSEGEKEELKLHNSQLQTSISSDDAKYSTLRKKILSKYMEYKKVKNSDEETSLQKLDGLQLFSEFAKMTKIQIEKIISAKEKLSKKMKLTNEIIIEANEKIQKINTETTELNNFMKEIEPIPDDKMTNVTTHRLNKMIEIYFEKQNSIQNRDKESIDFLSKLIFEHRKDLETVLSENNIYFSDQNPTIQELIRSCVETLRKIKKENEAVKESTLTANEENKKLMNELDQLKSTTQDKEERTTSQLQNLHKKLNTTLSFHQNISGSKQIDDNELIADMMTILSDFEKRTKRKRKRPEEDDKSKEELKRKKKVEFTVVENSEFEALKSTCDELKQKIINSLQRENFDPKQPKQNYDKMSGIELFDTYIIGVDSLKKGIRDAIIELQSEKTSLPNQSISSVNLFDNYKTLVDEKLKAHRQYETIINEAKSELTNSKDNINQLLSELKTLQKDQGIYAEITPNEMISIDDNNILSLLADINVYKNILLTTLRDLKSCFEQIKESREYLSPLVTNKDDTNIKDMIQSYVKQTNFFEDYKEAKDHMIELLKKLNFKEHEMKTRTLVSLINFYIERRNREERLDKSLVRNQINYLKRNTPFKELHQKDEDLPDKLSDLLVKYKSLNEEEIKLYNDRYEECMSKKRNDLKNYKTFRKSAENYINDVMKTMDKVEKFVELLLKKFDFNYFKNEVSRKSSVTLGVEALNVEFLDFAMKTKFIVDELKTYLTSVSYSLNTTLVKKNSSDSHEIFNAKNVIKLFRDECQKLLVNLLDLFNQQVIFSAVEDYEFAVISFFEHFVKTRLREMSIEAKASFFKTTIFNAVPDVFYDAASIMITYDILFRSSMKTIYPQLLQTSQKIKTLKNFINNFLFPSSEGAGKYELI